METALHATLTKTFGGVPVATVDNLPCGPVELLPSQLRALANALQRIADDCEAQQVGAADWTPTLIDYPLIGATLPRSEVLITRCS